MAIELLLLTSFACTNWLVGAVIGFFYFASLVLPDLMNGGENKRFVNECCAAGKSRAW
jgi:hypothetical protein